MFGSSSKKALTLPFVIVAIFALAMSGFSVKPVQADGPGLFEDAGSARPALARPNESFVVRSRYVFVNTGALFGDNGKPLGSKQLPQITLNLFSNTSYTGVVTSAYMDRWASYWIGRLKGVANGYFYLTVADGAFIAHIASPRGVYEVSWAGDGLYKVIQIDQSKFVDHDPAATFAEPGKVLPVGSLGPTADSGSFIDIMVAYTDDARAAEGSTAAMKSRIALAVAETNRSYANSGALTRLRLVHVEEYAYVESGNLNTDLTRFRTSGDGFFDTIHSLRNTYGADLLGLIVENGGAYCGLASTIMATSTTAFQVTDRGCATGYYSFGHEFGHLQGARHDTYVDTTNTPYAYGHGYVHPQTNDVNKRWRTIMAYNDRCSSWGYNCTRLQYWSNPHYIYLGDVMGVVGTSEVHRVLTNTAYTVANFRTSLIDGNFTSNFIDTDDDWSGIAGAWALSSGAYYRTTGLASLFSSAAPTGNYGDLTFEVKMKRTGTCTSCANHISIRGAPYPLDGSKRWNREYKFAYNNAGQYSVWEVNGASVVALKNWTASASIVVNNWNTLKVVAVGSSLKLYINGALVWSGTDTSLLAGKVGLGMYRDAAAGTLYIDWAKLTNTPTADFNPNETVTPGVELVGGDDMRGP